MNYKALILSILLFFVQGCTTAPSINKSDTFSSLENKFHIGEVTIYHYGSSTGKAIGAVTGGIVGMAIGGAVANSGTSENYENNLATKCNYEIKNTLSNSNLLILEEQSDLKLNYHIRYEAVANTVFEPSPVAMVVEWKLINEKTAELLVDARTIVKSDIGIDNSPDTKDPKYFNEYVSLAKKNAEDFLAIIEGKEPLWGKESIRLIQ